MLSEFDLYYLPYKSMKGRVVSNFFVDLPTQDQEEEAFNFPNEGVLQVEEDMWTMYFGGTSKKRGFRVGILLVSPKGAHTLISIEVDFDVINSVTEYKACIIGLQAIIEIRVKNTRVYAYSN